MLELIDKCGLLVLKNASSIRRWVKTRSGAVFVRLSITIELYTVAFSYYPLKLHIIITCTIHMKNISLTFNVLYFWNLFCDSSINYNLFTEKNFKTDVDSKFYYVCCFIFFVWECKPGVQHCRHTTTWRSILLAYGMEMRVRIRVTYQVTYFGKGDLKRETSEDGVANILTENHSTDESPASSCSHKAHWERPLLWLNPFFSYKP